MKSSQSVFTPCPYRAAFDAADGAMTSRAYAQSLIPTMRSWSKLSLKTALDQRPVDEAMAIIDDFYQAYEDEVASNPEGHAMDYVHLVIDVEKIQKLSANDRSMILTQIQDLQFVQVLTPGHP